MRFLQSYRLVFLIVFFAVVSGCKKIDTEDRALVQLQKDEQLIKDFLSANEIEAERHPSGLYYVIDSQGEGNVVYTPATTVKVQYTLKLLNGQVIPQGTEPISFQLGSVIPGWQIGMQLIQQGGKIRLFVPSGYAYGTRGKGEIPPNTVLDFEIELLEVNN